MIRDFLKNSAIYGIGKLFVVLLGFLTIPIITRTLSPHDYGVFELLNLCLILLNLSVAMEVSQAVARYIVDTKSKDERREFVSTAYFFSLFSYVIFSLILYVFKDTFAEFVLNDLSYVSLSLYLIPWIFLHGSTTFISNQFRWENKPTLHLVIQACMGISLLGSVSLFLIGMQPSIESLIHAYLLSQAVTLLLGFSLVYRHKIMGFLFSMNKLKLMLLFSLPLVPSSLAVFGQSYIDRVMITHMLDHDALGLYSLAFKIASIVAVLAGVFQLSLVPLIYKNHKAERTANDLRDIANIYLFFVLCAILALVIFTDEIFYIFVGNDFAGARSIVPVLLLSVGIQNVYALSPGLAIAKKTHYIALINALGMVINFVLNYLFIMRFGLIGAAYATLLSAIITCATNIVINQKHYYVPYHYGAISIAMSITVACIAIVQFVQFDLSITLLIGKILATTMITALIGYILCHSQIRTLLKTRL